jgi:hypothetical protein
MPKELMTQVLQNNVNDSWFVEFVQSFKFNTIKLAETQQLIAELDQRRGCKFNKTFPELTPYFQPVHT